MVARRLTPLPAAALVLGALARVPAGRARAPPPPPPPARAHPGPPRTRPACPRRSSAAALQSHVRLPAARRFRGRGERRLGGARALRSLAGRVGVREPRRLGALGGGD